MITKQFSKLATATIILLCIFSSCFKGQPSAPPDDSNYDPHLAVTHSIAQFQAMQQNVTITDEIVLSGTVTMNDETGNCFNKIFIQDETGGISIGINQSGLSKSYPVGRKLYVKCKGLTLGNDHQSLVLCMGIEADGEMIDIPESLVNNYLIKANYPNAIKPDTLSLATLASLYTGLPYLNKLVVVKEVEFSSDDIALPFAQNKDLASFTDHTIQDCSHTKLTLRTSSYASFQPLTTPPGHGYITGIYTRNNFSPLLMIRDTSDVQFHAVRCDGTLPDKYGITTLSTIRSLCPTTEDSISDLPGYKISGVVISDKNAGNINPAYAVIQEGEKGIVLQFKMPHALNLGDSVVVDIHHAKLSRRNSLLQISDLPLTVVNQVGLGKVMQPRIATIADINAHYADWESTLITVNHSTIPGGGTYSGSKLLEDGSGTIVLYTRAIASFAPAWVSPGIKNYTGILSIFNDTKQLQMRNIGDVH